MIVQRAIFRHPQSLVDNHCKTSITLDVPMAARRSSSQTACLSRDFPTGEKRMLSGAPWLAGFSVDDRRDSSSAPATGSQRVAKRIFFAVAILFAMSVESPGAGVPSVGLAPAAFVRSAIHSNPFEAMPLEYDTEPAQRIRVQMVTEKSYLITYFLDQVPSDINVSTMPKTARDVIVARVSMTRKPVYQLKREQSDESAAPKNLFGSRLRLLQVISGRATVGENMDVTFGVPDGSGKLSIHPLTPSQVNRDYFVVSYVDDDGRRRLAGFPIDEAQYEVWESEVRDFNKSLWTPGIPK
jgi:hypothetical protein